LLDVREYLSNYIERCEKRFDDAPFIDLYSVRQSDMESVSFTKSKSDKFEIARDLNSDSRFTDIILQGEGVIIGRDKSRYSGDLGIGNDVSNVTDNIYDFISSEEAVLFLLLGDYGSGKTTVLEKIMLDLSSRFQNSSLENYVPIPALIDLSRYGNYRDLDDLITHYFNDEVGSERFNLSLFYKLVEEGKVVLLLDGFDEMAQEVTIDKRKMMFSDISNIVGSSSNIILSGRPNYFPTLNEMTEHLSSVFDISPTKDTKPSLSASTKVIVSYLQLMTDDQIRTFTEEYASDSKIASRSYELIENNARIKDLSKRPVLAEMIIESVESIGEDDIENIDNRRLYDIYTRKWIDREVEKGDYRLLVSAEDRINFMGLIALNMHVSESEYLHYKELDQFITKYFDKEDDIVESINHDIRTCTYLSRDDQGNYRFAHRSFMEYFVDREFEKGEESVYEGRIDTNISGTAFSFMDYDNLSDNVRKFVASREIIRSIKKCAVQQQYFEVAAKLKDYEEEFISKNVHNWPSFKGLDSDNVIKSASAIADEKDINYENQLRSTAEIFFEKDNSVFELV
jgi:GTPase SAR1 family protein